MSLWTGLNDAPLSTQEERMANLTAPQCDHIIGLDETKWDGSSEVRQSEGPYGMDVVFRAFAFCPICGLRIASDDACGFAPTTDNAPASKA